MMVGAILKAAELKLIVMIDGFIASSALLVAHKLYPQVLEYCVFSHVSNERGHRALLDFLNVRALLAMDLRLGEGSGAALAFPLLQSAVLFLKEMASFDEAGVDQ
jgi:nicotinate-nucleotide--dimethylbenzimidazole phosphoribosyltransferase